MDLVLFQPNIFNLHLVNAPVHIQYCNENYRYFQYPVFLSSRILPESFHWLIVNGKSEKAKKQLLHASRMNGVVCSESDAAKIVDGAIVKRSTVAFRF